MADLLRPQAAARVSMRHVPNLLTALRLGLVPVTAALLLSGRLGWALAFFAIAAASDLLDGVIARRWQARTDLGALLDPVADKLTMASTALILCWLDRLPVWLAVTIAARDILIVCGVTAYRRFVGPPRMAPSPASKANTAMEFLTLLGTLAAGAGLLPGGRWLEGLVVATLVTLVASSVDYLSTGARWFREAAARRTGR